MSVTPTSTLLLALLALAPVASGAAAATYRNPLLEADLADPAVLRHEGVYYLYATGEVNGDNGIRVHTSTNLVDWQRGPVVFEPGQPHVWAPDVWRDPASGRFYLYYTVNETVGVADADGPLGPFTARRKFFDRAIDAHLFRDDDGRLYLYYVQFPGFRVSVQPMAGPMEPAGEPREILHPESAWETQAGRVTEGPWMIKRGNRYYLLYSGSGASTPDYAVGYATADNPLGPFTRAAHNPILHRSEGLFGPGHGCAIQDPAGQWWHVYHQKRTDRIEWPRFVALDRLWFDQHGELHGRATRGTPQPVPAVAAPAGARQYDPFVWKSEPPADCPFEPSRDLTGLEFLGSHSDYRFADTWYPSWAADGNLYSPWTDGPLHQESSTSDAIEPDPNGFGGFRLVRGKATTGQAVMIGDDPTRLEVRSLGRVQADPHPYGGRYPCGASCTAGSGTTARTAFRRPGRPPSEARSTTGPGSDRWSGSASPGTSGRPGRRRRTAPPSPSSGKPACGDIRSESARRISSTSAGTWNTHPTGRPIWSPPARNSVIPSRASRT
jgi:GH43 family beta-xylosidase